MTGEYGKRNNIKIDTAKPFRCEYAYVDTVKHRADRLFIDVGIPVRFSRKEFTNGSGYAVVFCTFKKKYEPAFLECMEQLDRALSITGGDAYGSTAEFFSGLMSE